MKTCTKCNETKAVSEFNRANASKDGMQSYCRACHKLARKPKEHIAHLKREWDVANREKVAAYKADYYANNTDFMKQLAADNYKKNYELYPGLYAEKDVVKRGELSDIYDMPLCNEFYLEARRLTKETGILHEVDHIKPIAAGGLHCQTNLQVLTKAENMKKGSKWNSI